MCSLYLTLKQFTWVTMPDRKAHWSLGFIVGCFYMILSWNLIKVQKAVFTVSESIFFAMLGLGTLFFMLISIATVASIFPDFIEPPTSKYHRGFFHSQFMFIIASLLNLMSFLSAMMASDLATIIRLGKGQIHSCSLSSDNVF